jgi:hypothetical protein
MTGSSNGLGASLRTGHSTGRRVGRTTLPLLVELRAAIALPSCPMPNCCRTSSGSTNPTSSSTRLQPFGADLAMSGNEFAHARQRLIDEACALLRNRRSMADLLRAFTGLTRDLAGKDGLDGFDLEVFEGLWVWEHAASAAKTDEEAALREAGAGRPSGQLPASDHRRAGRVLGPTGAGHRVSGWRVHE